MPTYDVPVWVTVKAIDQEAAWLMVSDIVGLVLSEHPQVESWTTDEPREGKATDEAGLG